MIRRTELNAINLQYANFVRGFVNQAIDNQVHGNDFLLILASGQYDESIAQNSKAHLSGYTTGHQFEQFSTKTTQKFMKWYFEESGFIADGVLPKVDLDKELQYHTSIKIESMIYLSYWESDMTLMILYQLGRLIMGERYDWHWRDKLSKSTNRNEFFRKEVKNPIRDICPDLYEFYKRNVVGQIRNAIAHSQIAPLNNEIKLLNFSKDSRKYSPISLLRYSEWERLICSTLAFRANLVSALNEIGKTAKHQMGDGKFNAEVEMPNGIEKGYFSL